MEGPAWGRVPAAGLIAAGATRTFRSCAPHFAFVDVGVGQVISNRRKGTWSIVEGTWMAMGVLVKDITGAGRAFLDELATSQPKEEAADLVEGRNPVLTAVFPGFFEDSMVMWLTRIECAAFSLSLVLGGVTSVLHLAPTTCILYYLGASWGPGVASGALWRLVLPIFLHASVPHLLTNALFQLRFGFSIERAIGSGNFLLLYLGAGAFGNLFSTAMDPFKLAVGASTSGLGIMGATFAANLIRWDRQTHNDRQWAFVQLAILAGLMVSSNTDIYGHIGGFIGGATLMFLLSPEAQRDRARGREVAKVALAVVVVFASSRVLGPRGYRDLQIACPALSEM